MSTIESSRVEPAPGSPDDPFRYGWRYVVRRQSSGRLGREQIPLTLEDLLFPEEGDQTPQFPSHTNDRHYLVNVFKTRVADNPMAMVLSDCRVRFDVPGLRPLGPDVAIFFNLRRDWDGGTLEVAKTGARPALVVEITSPDTRKHDFGPKKAYYHRAGVPLYVIVDARPGPKGRRMKLHGFRRDPEGYEPLPLDDLGRLWIGTLGIWLAVGDRRVICIEGRTGERFLDYVELVRARAAAEARLAEIRARAQKESRIRDLEAELRRLRSES